MNCCFGRMEAMRRSVVKKAPPGKAVSVFRCSFAGQGIFLPVEKAMASSHTRICM